jgi:hypothetical protein
MIWVTAILIVTVIVVAALYGYKKWGASDARRKQQRQTAKELEKDAAIAARHPIDAPLDKL